MKLKLKIMIGFFTSVVKNFFFIGYSIIEALVFMLAFNCIAPYIHENFICMPVVNIGYWVILSAIVLINMLGGFIKTLLPSFSINHTHNNKD